jgi:acyl-[acyl carrier protein]--UDP-N-acetylglucosamine O-acyltransferase
MALKEAMAAVERECAGAAEVEEILAFIRSSKRGITR